MWNHWTVVGVLISGACKTLIDYNKVYIFINLLNFQQSHNEFQEIPFSFLDFIVFAELTQICNTHTFISLKYINVNKVYKMQTGVQSLFITIHSTTCAILQLQLS